jgi:outer membrane protein
MTAGSVPGLALKPPVGHPWRHASWWVALILMAAGSAQAATSLPPPHGPDPLTLRWATSLSPSVPGAPAAPMPQAMVATQATQASPSQWPLLITRADEQAAANRVADAGALAAQGMRQQAWATAWMPRLDAAASATKRHQQVNETRVDTPTTSASLQATLPLWRASDRATARAQDASAEQARWQARQSRTSVGRDLSSAWLSAVEAAENRRLTLAQQALLQEQLRINERRLQAGVGTVLDLLETRTRVDQARATVQDLDTRLATQRLTLERLSRQPVLLPAGLNEQAPALPQVVPALDEALQQVRERNPAVLDAQAQINAAQAIDQARSAEYWQPTLDAVASASRVREVPQLDGVSQRQTTTERAYGLQMNWALFTGGVQQGRTREAAALLVQAQARHDEALSQAETSLRDAYQTLAQARQVITVQRQVEQTATATFDAIRKAFVAGMRTNIDLLNAQQQIYAARQSVVSARLNALAAQVSILATLDQLDAEHIAPLTPLFDTAALPVQPEPAP